MSADSKHPVDTLPLRPDMRTNGVDIVDKLQQRFRSRWVGVTFYRDGIPPIHATALPNGRFCEAVTHAYTGPVVVTRENLHCPGANHVFSWDDSLQTVIIDKLHRDEGFSLGIARELVKELPTVKGSLAAIGLNVVETPDVVISYLQPGRVMHLLRQYQRAFGKDLAVNLSSLVSVCGHVALQSFLEQRIALSFGCVYSRLYGSITRDRVAVGMPSELARGLLGHDG